jgi:hypothetical protein
MEQPAPEKQSIRKPLGAPVLYGQHPCQARYASGTPCRNFAYWRDARGSLHCGVHASDGASQLPKMTKSQTERLAEEKQRKNDDSVEGMAMARRETGAVRGELRMRRLQMMKGPELIQGFINVFPNNRAGNRKDGLGMPELSPMRLGPVTQAMHRQPGVRDAASIEAFHQGNKAFKTEVDAKGNPLPIFFERQDAFYQIPDQRHKLGKTKQEHMKNAGISPGSNANQCVCSFVRDPDGVLRAYSYVHSRQFYCRFYEELAKQTEAFKELHRLLWSEMKSLCIWEHDGLDGFSIGENEDAASVFEKMYLDESVPFGHGKVLMALLVLSENEYPWRKHIARGLSIPGL